MSSKGSVLKYALSYQKDYIKLNDFSFKYKKMNAL